jgi:3-deoxy-7-phosphoheptulonate synthase
MSLIIKLPNPKKMITHSVKLPSAESIREELPLPAASAAKIADHNLILRNIFEGKDQRKILIVGPCSAWPQEAVLEYARRIKPISEQVRDQIIIVLRTYIQKPRTTIGWTGPLDQPDPHGSPNMLEGIRYCREMMLKVAEIGLPMADEMLITHNDGYFSDLLSYLALGARSAEDQEHRNLASSLDIPTGIKNPTSGDVRNGINGVIAVQNPHTFPHNGYQITSTGNPLGHLILRGGQKGPNYSFNDLVSARDFMKEMKIQNPSVVIDASHDNLRDANGKKDPANQPRIIDETLLSMSHNPELQRFVKGWMVESFLENGAQKDSTPRDQMVFGKSITDPCISLDDFTPQIYTMHTQLRRMREDVLSVRPDSNKLPPPPRSISDMPPAV